MAETDKQAIKQHIIDLMLAVPADIQRLVAASLECISETDFPNKWQDLLPNLLKRLQTSDFNVILGVLNTIHAILRRFVCLFVSFCFCMYLFINLVVSFV